MLMLPRCRAPPAFSPLMSAMPERQILLPPCRRQQRRFSRQL
jgi:hypothetical protein